MTMFETYRPRLGEPGAECHGCGQPLAEDQRYCLSCGERRADARLPFVELLRDEAQPAAAPMASGARSTGALQRLGSNTAAIAGVGCLLLAMGVGVLIGKSDGEPTRQSAAPQVISVGGAAAGSSDAAASTDTPATSKAASKQASSKRDAAAESSSSSKATNPALSDLEKSGGNDYAKKAAKLPKTVGTGGKPPPKDNKPAAGGGEFEEIK